MPEPLLDCESLALTAGALPRSRSLFTSLTMRVSAGERWVVVGPNGAGKSSLLAALAGVFPVAHGAIRIDGKALARWSPAELACRRAWSPQFWSDPFASTVAETAALAHERSAGWLRPARAEASTEVAAVLDRFAIGHLARSDVRTLSGGERQRVAIATAVLQGAPLLLLDEPASHLDPAHQRLLLAVLREQAEKGGGVVASLHDLDLAWDLASHAVLIDGRGAALAGPRDDVLCAPALSAAFAVTVEAITVRGVRRFVVLDPVDAAPA